MPKSVRERRARRKPHSAHASVVLAIDARELLVYGDQDLSEVAGLPIFILTENEDPVAVSNRSCTIAELPDPAARLGIERLGVVAEHMVRRGTPCPPKRGNFRNTNGEDHISRMKILSAFSDQVSGGPR